MLNSFSIIIALLFMALCSVVGMNIFWMRVILNRHIEAQVERNGDITEEELIDFAGEARNYAFKLSIYTIVALFFLGVININLSIFINLCFAINYVRNSNMLSVEV